MGAGGVRVEGRERSGAVAVAQAEQVQALGDVLHLLLVHASHKHAALVLSNLEVLALGPQQVLRTTEEVM